jgi:membrane-associated phospholipid phosphatase
MNSPEARQDAAGAKVSTPEEEKRFSGKRGLALRILITFAAMAVWFWTQSLLGARTSPSTSIGDGLHKLTAPLNAYFQGASHAANALLIVSSALIDAIAIFLLASWIFAGRLRPFLGLGILLVTRQVMQALVSLPPPPGIIWHYPGVPSLLVTYGVANDFFFSGHTAIAVFGAIELASFRKTWLTALAVCVVIFEIAAVLVLRAHYTMDVFTGALAAVCVAQLCSRISDRRPKASSRPAG